MQPEIVILVIFVVLCVVFGVIYFFGDKLKLKKGDKKPKSKKDGESKSEDSKPSEPKKKADVKVQRPVLLSPEPPKKETVSEITQPQDTVRNINQAEIDEIKRFIENRPNTQTFERHGLSDYNTVEEFGSVIDLDDDYNASSDYGAPVRTSGDSEFLKNRGDDKLYEELKNMSPEMKKIIMADILKRRSDE